MKRRIVWVMAVLLIFAGVGATASPAAEHARKQWQEVIDEFGLETVDRAPPGVTPLVVHSPGQLRKFLAGRTPEYKVFNFKGLDLHVLDMPEEGGSRTLTTYVPLHAQNSSQWPIIFHLYANVWVTGSGSFWEITDCDDWAEFTGWEAFSETGGEWSRHRIAGDRQSIKIDGGGYIKHYIWTPLGKIHVFTYRFNMTINYRIS